MAVLAFLLHYLIIEKNGGRYRVFQAHTKIFEGQGYTAHEWCTFDSLPNNQVHKVYDGGLTGGDTEINTLLDSIVGLQKTLLLLIPSLLQHIPGIDAPSVAPLFRQSPSQLTPTDMQPASTALQIAAQWSHEVGSLVEGPLGITTVSEHANPVEIVQGHTVLFHIPQNLYQRVRNYNQQLTGESYLTPMVFVGMVNSRIWWEHCKHPEDGGGAGFTVRGAALDVVQSYDEGYVCRKLNRIESKPIQSNRIELS